MKTTKFNEVMTKIEARLWSELEAEFGEPIARPFRQLMREQVITRDTKDWLENDWLPSIDGDPEGEAALVESFKRQIRERWDAGLVYARTCLGHPSKTTQPKREKVYRKSLQRRVHLLTFVFEHKGGITERADWKALTAAWNEVHPFDTMTPALLKTEFYQARKDDVAVHNCLVTIVAPVLTKGLAHVASLFEQLEAFRPPGLSAPVTLGTLARFERETGKNLGTIDTITSEDAAVVFTIAEGGKS